MKILLTGGLGYIGTVLTPYLKKSGYEYRNIDIDLYPDSRISLADQIFHFEHRDIRDIDADDLLGIDTVIHLAALSNDPLGDINPKLTEEINYKATMSLASNARKAGVKKFIFASSCSNYGQGKQILLDEHAELNPLTPYARSKVRSEIELLALADKSFCPVIMRFGTLYGLSPKIRFDLVVNNLMAWAISSGVVHLKSDGTAWRPLLHVRDACNAIMTLVDADTELIRGEVFNVGSTTENYRIITVAQIICKAIPGSQIRLAPNVFKDDRNYRVNCDKWDYYFPLSKATRTVHFGVEELWDYLSNNPITPNDFEGPKYSRVKSLTQKLTSGTLDANLRPQ